MRFASCLASRCRGHPTVLVARLLGRQQGIVNALPPLKWCSFWANPSLDEFHAQGPVPTPWTQVDPGVFSRLRRAAPGDLPTTLWVRLEQFRPNGWRPSHDVATRLMFSSRADSFSPANRLHPHYQGTNPSVSRASPFAGNVYRNHHSFTYAARSLSENSPPS